MKAYRVLGLCDDVSTCEFCGKEDLQRVVAFREVTTDEVLYAGTTCAERVKLIVLDEKTGEAVERTAGQILALAKRAEREAALSASLELAGWKVVALLSAWRESQGEGMDQDMTIWSSGGYELRITHGDKNGQVLVRLPATLEGAACTRALVCGWGLRTYKISGLKSLKAQEQHTAKLHEWIEAMQMNAATRLARAA